MNIDKDAHLWIGKKVKIGKDIGILVEVKKNTVRITQPQYKSYTHRHKYGLWFPRKGISLIK